MTPKITSFNDAPTLQLARRRNMPADLERAEFHCSTEALQALVCLLDGHVGKSGFVSWLRGLSWAEDDISDLVEVLGYVFTADAEVHGPRIVRHQVPERWSW